MKYQTKGGHFNYERGIKVSTELKLPALKGIIGDWVYYVTLLSFREVRNRVRRNDEIHETKELQDWLQRELTDRSEGIAGYLETQKQRFFNAVVIGVYGGDPQWYPLSLRPSEYLDPTSVEEDVEVSMGILRLSGDEKLFAIDGQHRVEGIKHLAKQIGEEAFEEMPDELCAIFVAHKKTTDGMQRTRRLFSTLNRHAKAVSLSELIILDEDDVVAITCRRLIEKHPLFMDGKISLQKQKSISSKDQRSFTSVIALYQSMDTYLSMDFIPKNRWKQFKSVCPNEEVVQQYVSRAYKFWDKLVERIPELQFVVNMKLGDELPNSFRGTHGGDLLFRPILPLILTKTLKDAVKLGMSEDTFLSRFSKIPRELDRPPWRSVLWTGTMVTRKKNQKIAENLVLWMVDADPQEKKIKAGLLRQDIADLQDKPIKDIQLPEKVVRTL